MCVRLLLWEQVGRWGSDERDAPPSEDLSIFPLSFPAPNLSLTSLCVCGQCSLVAGQRSDASDQDKIRSAMTSKSPSVRAVVPASSFRPHPLQSHTHSLLYTDMGPARRNPSPPLPPPPPPPPPRELPPQCNHHPHLARGPFFAPCSQAPRPTKLVRPSMAAPTTTKRMKIRRSTSAPSEG
jgi:hypothetical protein